MADTGVIAEATGDAVPSRAPEGEERLDTAAPSVAAASDDRSRVAERWFLLALGIVVLAVVGVGVRSAANGWLPLGDNGFFALRAHDVLTRHPPLVGTASSASTYSGAPTSHPGPLQFVLLSVPVAVFGVGPGTVLGTALVNALSIGGAVWLVRRRFGTVAGAAAAFAFSGLAWGMGSALLHDVWGPFAVVLPFGLFLVAAALAAGGDVRVLPVVTFAGSMVLQTHVSYVLLVPGLMAVSFAGALLCARRDQPGDASPDDRPPRRGPVLRTHESLRWMAVAVGVAVLCWLPPLVQEVQNEPGNISALIEAAGADAPATVSAQQGLYLVSGTVALPPWWFAPGFEKAAPLYNGLDSDLKVPLGNIGMAVLAVPVALALWSAVRRRDRLVLAALSTAVAGVLLGYVSILRAPAYGVWAATYTRYLWPLSLWLWLCLGLAAARARADRRAASGSSLAPASVPAAAGSDDVAAVTAPDSGEAVAAREAAAEAAAAGSTRTSGRGWAQRVERAVLPALAAAVAVVSAMAFPHRDNIVADRDSWQRAAHPLIDAVLAEVDGIEGPILMKEVLSQANFTFGPMLMAEFADRGIDFVVDGPAVVRQVGAHRAAGPGHEPVAELWLLHKPDPDFDGEMIFSDSGLPPAKDAEMDEIVAELEAAIDSGGSLRMSEDAQIFYDSYLPPDVQAQVDELLATRPLTPKALHDVSDFVFGNPLLWENGETLDRDLLLRWERLDRDRTLGQVVVYLRRIDGSASE